MLTKGDRIIVRSKNPRTKIEYNVYFLKFKLGYRKQVLMEARPIDADSKLDKHIFKMKKYTYTRAKRSHIQ